MKVEVPVEITNLEELIERRVYEAARRGFIRAFVELFPGKRLIQNGDHNVPANEPEKDVAIASSMTEDETRLLDEMSRSAHENGETPFMDSLETQEKGRGKQASSDSVRSLMLKCLSECNGTAPKSIIVSYIAERRPDMDNRQIVNNINTISCRCNISKNNGVWSLPAIN